MKRCEEEGGRRKEERGRDGESREAGTVLELARRGQGMRRRKTHGSGGRGVGGAPCCTQQQRATTNSCVARRGRPHLPTAGKQHCAQCRHQPAAPASVYSGPPAAAPPPPAAPPRPRAGRSRGPCPAPAAPPGPAAAPPPAAAPGGGRGGGSAPTRPWAAPGAGRGAGGAHARCLGPAAALLHGGRSVRSRPLPWAWMPGCLRRHPAVGAPPCCSCCRPVTGAPLWAA